MITITNTDDITAAFAIFAASAYGAYATCRCLSGQYDQQEWAEHGTIEGKAATVYYIFENSEAEVEDSDGIPFDAAHISHIVIAA